jgi:hypothetical protein
MNRLLIIIFSIIYCHYNTSAQCNGALTYTMNPAPVANQLPAGTIVEVCVTMVGFNMIALNWFEGFNINLGAGWLAGSISPISAPAVCSNSNGSWIWVNSFVAQGNNFGPGYFFDYNNDGISQNDFGDQGSCTWTCCFSITVGNTIGASLGLGVMPVSDGEAASWGGGSGCWASEVLISAPIIIVGAPCTLNCGIDSITNVSCYNDSNGTCTLLVSGGFQPFTYMLDSIGISTLPVFENLTAGNYVAHVTDSFGCTSQTSFTITQPSGPFEVTLMNGGSSFFCTGQQLELTTDSSIFYSYQWILNGTQISSANSYNYMAQSSGTYSVLVTNENNCIAISDSFYLNEINPPQINFSPVDTTVLENENATFVVQTNIDSVYTYQWQVNTGTGFTNLSNSSIYSGVDNDTLIVNNVPLNFDNFQYRCEISNSICISISDTAHLHVSVLSSMNDFNMLMKHVIKITPNPAVEIINIETNSLSIGKQLKIYDILGNLRFCKTIQERNFSIPTNTFTKGIYFIQIDEKYFPQKLIIE